VGLKLFRVTQGFTPSWVPRERPPYTDGKRQLGGTGRSAPGPTDLLTGFAL